MAIIKSCRYCVAPKRHPGCHDTCPEYQEEKAEYNKCKERYDKKMAVIGAIHDQRGIQVRKALKNRKRGGYNNA